MKKIFIYLLFSITYSICFSQELPTSRNKLNLDSAQSLIEAYHKKMPNPWPVQSFIINTQFLSLYLNDVNTPKDSYFHIYFGIDTLNGVQNLQLIFVPTIVQGVNAEGNPYIIHNPNYTFVFITCANDTQNNGGFQYMYDPQLDDPSNSDDNVPTYISYINPPNQKIDVKNWISDYQEIHSNQIDNNAKYTQSFNFSANKLKYFLNTNNSPFLQIYIGYNDTLSSQDKLTLVFTGLDNYGQHIYSNNFGGASCVFEECRPCPICGVVQDKYIDDQPQLILKHPIHKKKQ